MGCCFLAVAAAEPIEDAGESLRAAARFLPFVSESHATWESANRRVVVAAWSVVDEGSRGGWFAADEAGAVAYNGWLQEEACWPVEATVATNLLSAVRRTSAEAVFDDRAGEFSVVSAADDGLVAVTDFLGGSHVYYGERRGRTVVSSRAFMVAAALNPRAGPELDVPALAWLASGTRAMCGGDTALIDVRILGPGERLRVRSGSASVVPPTPESDRPVAMDWDTHAAEMAARAAYIGRLPGVRCQQTLTGGKDSRLVLAALLSAGATRRLDGCFVEAAPGHPDAIVAESLAAQHGIAFERREPRRDDDLPYMQRLARHVFQTEGALHAWDTKGTQIAARTTLVGGSYGEIFKSHLMVRFMAGWPVVRATYGSRSWLDRWRLLTEVAFERCKARLLAEAARWRAEGTPLVDVHDRWHRECRMHRWLGQALQHDGIAGLSFNPLPSPHLLRRYQRLSPVDRKTHRLHFELMRRLAPDLWRQPLANDRWSPWLTVAHGHRPPAVRGGVFRISPQLRWWKEAGAELASLLLDPRDDGLFDIVRREAVRERVAAARAEPSLRVIEQVLCVAGIRLLLGDAMRPQPMSVAPAAGRPA